MIEPRMAKAAEAYKAAVEWQKQDPNPSEQLIWNYGTLLLSPNRTEEALVFALAGSCDCA